MNDWSAHGRGFNASPYRARPSGPALPLCEGENQAVHLVSAFSPSQGDLCVRRFSVFRTGEREKRDSFSRDRLVEGETDARFPEIEHTSPLAGGGFQH